MRAGLSVLTSRFALLDAGYYYLYALERCCILYGTETLGAHKWYAEGVKALLDAQKPDGSWGVREKTHVESAEWNTCFAILFLRRATRPLQDVDSEDRAIRKAAADK